MPSQNGQSSTSSTHNSANTDTINKELIDEVTELVIKMWKRDLRIERERLKPRQNPFNR